MAYRGGGTDPLDNIINQHRAMKRLALVVVALWVLPYLLQFDPSVLRSVFETAGPQAPATVPAPTASSAPARKASAAPARKMSAGALEQLLRTAPASNRAPRDVRCTPGVSGWDYVCTYQDGPHFQTRLKIGVRVSGDAIEQASAPHPFARPLATP